MSEDNSDSSVNTDSESEEEEYVSANSQPGGAYDGCDDLYRSDNNLR